MNYYIVHIKPQPWGDYGNILWNGLCRNYNGNVFISRTGPFIPPIYYPYNNLIINQRLYYNFSEMDFSGIEWHEASYEKIVNLPWELWDKTTDLPPLIPKSGEPEDYISRKPNDKNLIRMSQKSFYLKCSMSAAVKRKSRIIDSINDLTLDLKSTNHYDRGLPS